jgi:hypothetical protein
LRSHRQASSRDNKVDGKVWITPNLSRRKEQPGIL